jgi:hypothetical protein
MLLSPRTDHDRSPSRKGKTLPRRTVVIGSLLAVMFTAPVAVRAQSSGKVERLPELARELVRFEVLQ